MKVKETLVSLNAGIDGFSGSSYKVHVDFFNDRFFFMEWRNKDNIRPFTNIEPKAAGSIEDFKREICLLNIWDWEPTYREDTGIILDGKFWFVKLNTKGKVFESEGIECFPPNWGRFCNAIEKLTGTPFR